MIFSLCLLLSGCWHRVPDVRCLDLCGGTLDADAWRGGACVCVEDGR